MIKYYCNRCKKELSREDGRSVKMKIKEFRDVFPVRLRLHLCEDCENKLIEFLDDCDSKGCTEE